MFKSVKALTFTLAIAAVFATPQLSVNNGKIEFNTHNAYAMSAQSTIAMGEFKGADRGHQGQGIAKFVKDENGVTTLELSNFQSTPGPDLKVYLVKTSQINDKNDVLDNEYVSLGELKSSSGDQSYILPEGVDANEFGAVAIFCQKYSVLFSSASLK